MSCGAPGIVTVDGPAGSGKTTLGRRLASALELPLVDTGLFYRGVMVAALRAGLDASNPEAAAAIAGRARIEVNVDPDAPEEGWHLRVDGEDPGELARDPRHATLLAGLSAIPGVRAAILEQQRRPLRARGGVAVGRDCGTVVFVDAPVKLYLWASPQIRAHRRALQLAGSGAVADEAALRDEISGRDESDSRRAASPLRPAPDAHVIDTGSVGIDEMVREALVLCHASGIGGRGRTAGEKR